MTPANFVHKSAYKEPAPARMPLENQWVMAPVRIYFDYTDCPFQPRRAG